MEIGISKGNSSNRIRIDSFYGINRGKRPSMGEMENMQNMSSNDFPCASTCGGREEIATAEGEILKPVAPDLAFTDSITGFTGVCGNAFYYNGERKTTMRGISKFNSLSISLPENCQWVIEKMGDMYILNGYNEKTGKSYMFYYDIETDIFGCGGKVMPKMIVTVGNDNTGTYIEAFRNCGGLKDYVINYSDGTVFDCGDYSSLYHYGAGLISWKENLWQKYFKIGDELCVEGFRSVNEGQYLYYEAGDYGAINNTMDFTCLNTVDIDDLGSTEDIEVNKICKIVVSGFSKVTSKNDKHRMYVKTYNVYGDEYQYLALGSDLSESWYAGVTLSVKKPALNRVCVHQGRIWGTSISGRYIYASASDDIFSFSASDMENKFAWRTPSDTAGRCMAIKSYNGELVIFKEEAISVVSGYNVRNYQMNTIKGIGAISPESVVVTPRGIIFLSHQGFTVYNGGIPSFCGEKLLNKYISAVSAFDGRRYYASATDSKGNCEFLVYDTVRNLWHREDDFKATGFFVFRDGMFCCDKERVYKLHSDFDNVEWSMTVAPVYDFDLGGINEVWVQAEISEGGEFTVLTKDGNQWREHETFRESEGVTVYRAPVRFNKGNTFSLKINGRGRVVIHSVELVASYGGRRYKERL